MKRRTLTANPLAGKNANASENLDGSKVHAMTKEQVNSSNNRIIALRAKITAKLKTDTADASRLLCELSTALINAYCSPYDIPNDTNLVVRSMHPKELRSKKNEVKSVSLLYPNVKTKPYHTQGSRGCIWKMGENKGSSYGKMWIHDAETHDKGRMSPAFISPRHLEYLPIDMKEYHVTAKEKEVVPINKIRTKFEVERSIQYAKKYYESFPEDTVHHYNEMIMHIGESDKKSFSPFISFLIETEMESGDAKSVTLTEKNVQDFMEIVKSLDATNNKNIPCLICNGELYTVNAGPPENKRLAMNKLLSSLLFIGRANQEMDKIMYKSAGRNL